jgi:hypothetical protein
MKKVNYSIIFIFIALSLFAQSNYNEAIQDGEVAFKRGDYTTAIRKYIVARNMPNSNTQTVQNKLEIVYTAIDAQKNELSRIQTKLSATQKELAGVNNQFADYKNAEKVNDFQNSFHTKDNLTITDQRLHTAQNSSVSNATSENLKLKEVEVKQLIEFIQWYPKLLSKKNRIYPSLYGQRKSRDRITDIVNAFIQGNSDEKQRIINIIKNIK